MAHEKGARPVGRGSRLRTGGHPGGVAALSLTGQTHRSSVDDDQDGQRDAGEGPPALTDQLNLSLVPTDGGVTISIPVNADGTYRLALHPGRYQLAGSLYLSAYRFTTPDVGDDANDSDVHVTYEDTYSQAAESAPVGVALGDEVTLDVGLITGG